MMTAERKHSIQEMAEETRILADLLAEVAEGAFVSYEVLAAVADRDLTGKDRHILESARNIAQREHRAVFACVRGQGLERLPNEKIPGVIGADTIQKIRRAAGRGAKKVSCADYARLDREGQIRFNVMLSMLRTQEALASGRSLKKIEGHVQQTGPAGVLSIGETLGMFR